MFLDEEQMELADMLFKREIAYMSNKDIHQFKTVLMKRLVLDLLQILKIYRCLLTENPWERQLVHFDLNF
jgi:hypothetical protein